MSKADDSGLLPCPWCLGPADITSTINGDEGDGYMWHVFCAEDNDCAMMPDTYAESERVAIQRWNTRADSQPVPAGQVLSKSVVKRIAAQTAPAGQDEVEKALAELRTMFPGEPVSIEFHDYSGIEGCAGNGYITVTSGTHQSTEATLAEAMQKVREWEEKDA